MSKQLSLSEKIIIERMLHNDYTFASISRKLERSASTISREVLNYRCFVNPLPIPGENDCIHKFSCIRNNICDDAPVPGSYFYRCKKCPDHVCFEICNSYISSHCDSLVKPPYVCTECDKQKSCKLNHAYYTAHRANAAHEKNIKEAHFGIRKTSEELIEIGNLIKPLIERGQSLNYICTTHSGEIGVCERTLYKYIDDNVFDVRNIDLPKKVVYRRRKSKFAEQSFFIIKLQFK